MDALYAMCVFVFVCDTVPELNMDNDCVASNMIWMAGEMTTTNIHRNKDNIVLIVFDVGYITYMRWRVHATVSNMHHVINRCHIADVVNFIP